MITSRTIQDQVEESLGEFVLDFDVEGIVREIIDSYGLVPIDSIDVDVFWDITPNHVL